MKTALIQQACSENPVDNLAHSEGMIRTAAEQGAQLVVLPELHRTRYFCQQEDLSLFDLAEPIPGPSTKTLSQLADELKIVLIASLFEYRAKGLYHNTAVVLDRDGSIAGLYRKMHIPDDPGYYEKYYFTPGDLGFTPINTAVGTLGVLVCWDQWYPEAARLMTLAGAEMLVYPTAIGWAPEDHAGEQQRQRDAWITIQRSHAIANALPVLACNRVGHEPDASKQTSGIDFWGSSLACGPQGELLAKAGKQETIVLADIDLSRSEQIRREWPYLRDRRVDAYQDLIKRWRE